MSDLREGELLVGRQPVDDAQLQFIGHARTPWPTRETCPRQGWQDGPECRIELLPEWTRALEGLEEYELIDVLYWLDQSRRDLVVQNPSREKSIGTFALRSPNRPNPIGLVTARLIGIERNVVTVRGLDCIDGTPVIDIKPDRCAFSPKAPPKPGVPD